LLRPGTRAAAAAFAVTLAIYLAFTIVLLYGKLVERGAYMLPLVPAAGLLTLRHLGRRATVVLSVASLAVAVAEVQLHDRPRGDPAFAEGLARVAAREQVFVVCGGADEFEPMLRRVPEVPGVQVFWFGPLAVAGYESLCADFDRHFAVQAAAGRSVLLTAGAESALVTFGLPAVQRFLHEHLPERYVLQPVGDGAFAAKRLVPR
jgi:hypothetical protein